MMTTAQRVPSLPPLAAAPAEPTRSSLAPRAPVLHAPSIDDWRAIYGDIEDPSATHPAPLARLDSDSSSAGSPLQLPNGQPLMSRRASLNGSAASVVSKNNSIDKGSSSQRMGRWENLEEELLRTKKNHAFAMREVAIMRTRLKVLEKECKKKDQQIDELLRDDQNTSKSEQKLQSNSLKRKVVQYERALREKGEEVARAAENREKLEKMESECGRLRRHLAESIPESEFMKEKDQYMEIISQLTEENMQMRKLIGRIREEKETELLQAADNGFDDDALLAELRTSALAQKAGAEYYRTALNRLLKQRRHLTEKFASPARVRSSSAMPPNAARRRNPSAVSHTRLQRAKSSNDVAKRVRRPSEVGMSAPESEKPKAAEEGKEFMLPTTKLANHVSMYRNAIDSESSELEEDELGGGAPFDVMDSEESSDIPREVFDRRGRIYFIEREDEIADETALDTGLHQRVGESSSASNGDEGNEAPRKDNDAISSTTTPRIMLPDMVRSRVHALAHVDIESDGTVEKEKMESWLNMAEAQPEESSGSAMRAFIKTLRCHILRVRMLSIRQ